MFKHVIRVIVLLHIVMGAALPVAAKDEWRPMALTKPDKLTFTENGLDNEYYLLSSKKSVDFFVTGPAKIKIVTRLLFNKTSAAPGEYTVILTVDAETPKSKILSSLPGTVQTQDGKILGLPREINLSVPAGKHRYSLDLLADFRQKIAVQVQRRFKVAAVKPAPVITKQGRKISISPTEFANAVTLMVKEREYAYFRTTKDTPVIIEMNGPTQLKVGCRLEFNQRMLGDQNFRLEILEDNALKNAPILVAKRSDGTTYRSINNNKGKSPGLVNWLTVTVPDGFHVYTFKLRGTIAPGALLNFSIPTRDILRGEK